MFHATMYHLVKTYPGGVEQLLQDHPWFKFKTFFEMMGDDHAKAMEDWIGSILAQVKESLTSGGRPDLAEKLERNTIGWMDKSRTAGTPRPQSLKTLAHGDYWYANMMFK